MSVQIYVASEYSDSCDGCNRDISEGEFYIGGIDSCCGGCTRSLCFSCVKKAKQLVDATELLQELTNDRELLGMIEQEQPQLLKRLKELL